MIGGFCYVDIINGFNHSLSANYTIFFTDFQNPEAIVFVSYNFTVIFSRSQMISTV